MTNSQSTTTKSWVLIPRSPCFHLETLVRYGESEEEKTSGSGNEVIQDGSSAEVAKQKGALIHCGTVNALLSFVVQERCRQGLILEVQDLPFLPFRLGAAAILFSLIVISVTCAGMSHSLQPHGLS